MNGSQDAFFAGERSKVNENRDSILLECGGNMFPEKVNDLVNVFTEKGLLRGSSEPTVLADSFNLWNRPCFPTKVAVKKPFTPTKLATLIPYATSLSGPAALAGKLGKIGNEVLERTLRWGASDQDFKSGAKEKILQVLQEEKLLNPSELNQLGKEKIWNMVNRGWNLPLHLLTAEELRATKRSIRRIQEVACDNLKNKAFLRILKNADDNLNQALPKYTADQIVREHCVDAIEKAEAHDAKLSRSSLDYPRVMANFERKISDPAYIQNQDRAAIKKIGKALHAITAAPEEVKAQISIDDYRVLQSSYGAYGQLAPTLLSERKKLLTTPVPKAKGQGLKSGFPAMPLSRSDQPLSHNQLDAVPALDPSPQGAERVTNLRGAFYKCDDKGEYCVYRAENGDAPYAPVRSSQIRTVLGRGGQDFQNRLKDVGTDDAVLSIKSMSCNVYPKQIGAKKPKINIVQLSGTSRTQAQPVGVTR